MPDETPRLNGFSWGPEDPIRTKPTLFGNLSLRVFGRPIGKIYNPKHRKAKGQWVVVVAGQIPHGYNNFDEALANAYIFAAALIEDKGVHLNDVQSMAAARKLSRAGEFLKQLVERGEHTH